MPASTMKNKLYTTILAILTLTQCASSELYSNLSLDTNQADYEGYPAVYRDKWFEVTLNISLPAVENFNLFVGIELPFVYFKAEVCKDTISGIDFDCNYPDNSDVEFVLNNVTVEAGTNVNFTEGDPSKDYDDWYAEISISSNNIVLDTNGATEDNYIRITFWNKFPMSYEEYGGTYFSTVTFEDLITQETDYSESNVTIAVVGPVLTVGSTYSESDTGRKSSGATITQYGTVEHDLSGTDMNAENVTISVYYYGDSGDIKHIWYDLGDGQLLNGTVANPFEVTVTQLGESDYVDIVYETLLTDDVPLNSVIWFVADLSYANEFGDEFQRDVWIPFHTEPITFTSANSDGLHEKWYPKTLVKAAYVFSMDYGTLPDVEIELDGIYEDIDNNLITDIKSSIRTTDPNIQFDTVNYPGPTSPNTYSGQVVNNNQDIYSRKKRDVTGGLSYLVGFGDIVNPSSAGNPNAKLIIEHNSGIQSLVSMMSYPVLLFLLLLKGTTSSVVNPSPISMQLGDVQPIGSVSMTVALLLAGTPLYLDHVDAQLVQPDLQINNTVEMDGEFMRFNVTVDHTLLGDGDAYEVTMRTGSEKFDVYWGQGWIGPPQNDPEFETISDRRMKWTKSMLALNETMFLSYKSKPKDNGLELDDGPNFVKATVRYALGPNLTDFAEDESAACIWRTTMVDESVFYNYGLSAVGLLVGLIVGALIVLLILFILYKVRRENPFAPIRPESAIDDYYRNQGYMRENTGTLVLNAKDVKGAKSLKDFSKQGAMESIVSTLAMKDKLARMRALDNMDILTTINVDENIDDERNKAMKDATRMLIATLVASGDINKGTFDKTYGDFQKNVANLERDLDKDKQKEMEKILRKLSMKNKDKLTDLLERQADEKEAQHEKTRGMKSEEKAELDKLLRAQHETEREDMTFRLKLEQDEETEKLRKEFAVRKRIGIKGLQNDLLDNVRKQGKLSDQQYEWLMKEHYKNQAGLEKLYDDEISRQRMMLEEKLARRRALGEKSEFQDENHSELLNTMAGHQIAMIQKGKKDGALTKSEAQEMIKKVHQEMVEVKEKYDSERQKQEDTLHKKLSERKKHKMDAMAKQHQKEQAEHDKKMSSKASQGMDPLSVLESRQMVVSNQRNEMAELENEIDKENSEELSELRDKLLEDVTTEMETKKTHTVDDLTKHGLSEDQMRKIINKHEKELAEMKKDQEEDREKQEKHLKKRLAKRREEMEERKKEEKDEQENIREHEENVVRKLLDNQVAMSEEERSKVMQEHEKQLVKLENSLTLNKLSQRRMLEDKLAKKRARQMEKLEKKHASEEMKQARAQDSDDSETEFDKQMDLMKKHAEQKMSVMQGETLKLDDEMDQIRDEMMKERAAAMKEQEVKLGAMLAELQMAKAKEMAKIEEQQKAINNLKTNLMDDLNEKGVLSDPECQRVIEIHQQEQQKLNDKIESQRAKQEKAMRRRLEERLKQKETQMNRMQEQEIDEAYGRTSPSNPVAKLKRAALMTKHMVEMEQFRNKMDREMNQTLEEMKRQNEMKRLELLQDQELQFINGLVRLGKFRRDELENVVAMLFPTKKEAERKELLGTLLEGYKEPERSPEGSPAKGRRLQKRPSTLEQRVELTTLSGIETESLFGSMKGYNYFESSPGSKTISNPLATFSSDVVYAGVTNFSSDVAIGVGLSSLTPRSLPPVRKSQKKKGKNWLKSKSHDSRMSAVEDPEYNMMESDLSAMKAQMGAQNVFLTSDLPDLEKSSTKVKGKKGKRALPPVRGTDEDDRLYSRQNEDQEYYDSYRRPEPIGRSYSPEHRERDYNRAPSRGYEDDDYHRAPPSRLPPMESTGKKKKKKKTVGYADDDYSYSNRGYGSDGF